MATSIQAISNLASTASTAQTNTMLPTAPAAEGGTPFSDLVKDAAGEVDSLQSQAQAAVTGLMTGTGVDVHTAMIATEKASMAFELSLAVRNKAVQAYQQVMSMQF
jgi:flagellar hook-basal body complex protein FliE